MNTGLRYHEILFI